MTYVVFFFFQAEDGIRDRSPSRGLGDVYKRQAFLRAGDGIIELNSTNASKGNALYILCEKLGIQLENVLAIGDNENDISMLQAAGISAAMENAEDDVKQAAKFVAGNNEEDGAAHFLEEWVL